MKGAEHQQLAQGGCKRLFYCCCHFAHQVVQIRWQSAYFCQNNYMPTSGRFVQTALARYHHKQNRSNSTECRQNKHFCKGSECKGVICLIMLRNSSNILKSQSLINVFSCHIQTWSFLIPIQDFAKGVVLQQSRTDTRRLSALVVKDV